MADLSNIAQVVIHPAIGVARVGDSPDQYFLGPEIVGVPLTDPDDFRDSEGRIKRQAARFRLYGLDANGAVVGELTAEDGDITWTVHVANKKSAWYDFDLAFDIPAAQGKVQGTAPVVSTLRNKTLTGTTRERLAIDPGPISIGGVNTNADGGDHRYAFDKGTFYSPSGSDTPVYLGEVRTDADGRLLFLGGRGQSASYSDLPATTFANNETWHDDTSDGPVDATITLKDGRTLNAVGAWVLTAPPDYAPGVQAFVTGYDLLLQTALDAGYDLLPEIPSFWQHIYPILEKLPLNQWVNLGVFLQHGWGSPADLSTADMIRRLGDPGDTSLPLRQSIFQQFRNPSYAVIQAEYLPPIYGDGVQSFASTDVDPRNFMAILPFQYNYLRLWAEGRFHADTNQPPVHWDDLTPAQQVYNLDRATLDETIGGPFHPGCEFTWPMRNTLMYSAPFRIKRRPDAPLNYGPTLDAQQALAPGGPLDGSSPGDITRWMAVPWQTDTSSCLSGYVGIMGEYVPTFWPVRVPNDVLPEEHYRVLMDSSVGVHEKNAAFNGREKWLRGIVYLTSNPPTTVTPYTKGINEFIRQWSQVGIVVLKPGPEDTPSLPQYLWVETGRSVAQKTLLAAPGEAAQPLNEQTDSGFFWMIERARERSRSAR